MPPRRAAAKKATKAVSPEPEPVEAESPPQASTSKQPHSPPAEEEEEQVAEDAEDDAVEAGEAEAAGGSMDARMAKMQQLRKRLSESAQANRRELIQESNQRAQSGKQQAKLERKRKQAEAMGEKQDARETGEDLERKAAWEYSIEDNDNWDKKQAKKGRRVDVGFTDYDDVARRKYKKDVDVFKPDRHAYNLQKAAAEASSALVGASSGNAAAENLYRDVNTFAYADHKPSEDAIDRVIGKLNVDLDRRAKRSRERKNADDGDVTYINETNKHFNKKLERHLGQHTQEIRDSFERGTAL